MLIQDELSSHLSSSSDPTSYPFKFTPVELTRRRAKKARRRSRRGDGEEEEGVWYRVRAGKWSWFVVFVGLLVANLEVGVVGMVVWEYCEEVKGDVLFYGAVVAAFCGGSLCGSGLFHLWHRRVKLKYTYLVAFTISLVGDLALIFVSDKWFLLGVRFVSGVGYGVVGLLKESLVGRGKVDFKLLGIVQVAESLSFTLGPGISGVLSLIPSQQFPSPWGTLSITSLNAPAIFTSCTFLWTLLIFLVFFHQPEKNTFIDGDSIHDYSLDGDEDEIITLLEEAESGHETKTYEPVLSLGVSFISFLMYFSLFQYQTISIPYAQTTYHWHIGFVCLYWGGLSITSTISFFIVSICALQKLDDTTLFLLSTLLSFLSAAIALPFPSLPLWRFLLASLLLSLAFPVALTKAAFALRHLVPADGAHAWLARGTLPLSRVAGALAAGAAGEWAFLAGVVVIGLAGCSLLVGFKRVKRKVKESLLIDQDYS